MNQLYISALILAKIMINKLLSHFCFFDIIVSFECIFFKLKFFLFIFYGFVLGQNLELSYSCKQIKKPKNKIVSRKLILKFFFEIYKITKLNIFLLSDFVQWYNKNC